MTRLLFSTASILLIRTALGAYDNFFYATQESEWKCGELAYDCVAPSICAHEDLLNKHYCCSIGPDQVCWSGSDDCGSSNTPSSSQVGCGSGDNAYCCLKDKEECTQTYNQINICWARPDNPFEALTKEKSNSTYSSLLSASPSATALTVDTAALLATSSSIPASSAASTSASAATTSGAQFSSETATPPSPSPSSSSSLSGGAIGGIVVGAIAGVALLGGGGFFLWRRQRNADHGNELDSNPYTGGGPHGYGAVAQGPPQEKYAQHAQGYADASSYPQYSAPVEMPAQSGPVEVEGNGPGVTRPH